MSDPGIGRVVLEWEHIPMEALWVFYVCQISLYVLGKNDAVDLQTITIAIIAIFLLQVRCFPPWFTIMMHETYQAQRHERRKEKNHA